MRYFGWNLGIYKITFYQYTRWFLPCMVVKSNYVIVPNFARTKSRAISSVKYVSKIKTVPSRLENKTINKISIHLYSIQIYLI